MYSGKPRTVLKHNIKSTISDIIAIFQEAIQTPVAKHPSEYEFSCSQGS